MRTIGRRASREDRAPQHRESIHHHPPPQNHQSPPPPAPPDLRGAARPLSRPPPQARGNAPPYTVGDPPRNVARDTFITSLHYAGNTWWHAQATARASELLNGCGGAAECDWAHDFFVVGSFANDVSHSGGYVLS